MAFDAASSNKDEVLPTNPSASVFVFGDFNVPHRDWLTYSGKTAKISDKTSINPVGFLFFFFSQTALLIWFTFFFGSLPVTLTFLLFWICLFLLKLVIVYNGFASTGKFMFFMLFSQIPLAFLHTQKGMPFFIAQSINILVLIGTVFVVIWEMFCGKIFLNLVLLLLVLLEFYE